MSLETLIFTCPIEKQRARRIAHTLADQCGLRILPDRSLLGNMCRGFALPDVHDMLADDADWNAPIWKMDAAKLPRLADAIQELAAQLRADFTFYVAWVGEGKLRVEHIELPQLLSVIERNGIENRVEYVVSNPEGPTRCSVARGRKCTAEAEQSEA